MASKKPITKNTDLEQNLSKISLKDSMKENIPQNQMGNVSQKQRKAHESRYELLEKLGEGTYGKVYKARDRDSGKILALKRIKNPEEDTEGIAATSLREIIVLKELDHINIVKMEDIFYGSIYDDHQDKWIEKLYLVFEFVDFDLKKYMDKTKVMDHQLVKSYMYQLLRAMHYCHKRRILHRDLKPQNLLITRDGLLKVADFGLARAFGVPMRAYTHQVVTLWYRAPEVLLGEKVYGMPLDIWSIGCIFAEMVTTKPLFPGDSEIDQLYKIFKVLGTPNEQTWPGVSQLSEFKATFPQWRRQNLKQLFPTLEPAGVDLLSSMLEYEPGQRISCLKAIQHPYFNDLDKDFFKNLKQKS